ncbi:MAG: VOC family protein [Bacteroidota bacterium]
MKFKTVTKHSQIIIPKHQKGSLFIPFFILLFVSQSFSQKVQQVHRMSITVSDLDASIRFFEGNLDFRKVDEKTIDHPALRRLLGISSPSVSIKITTLRLGKEEIELLAFDGVAQRAIPQDSRSNDLWFQHIAIVVSNMEKAYEKLKARRIKHVSTSPQTLPDYIPAAAGIKAFYFQDPDAHNLEIIYFPFGKGDPRWQEKRATFLGIDHTAIGISNTPYSLAFYQDLLGMKLAGQSENYGSEQEHLNQVFGTRLQISGLKAPRGVGIEFLEYLAPPGGRAFPNDSKVYDLWHWHTSLEVDDLEAMFKKLSKVNVEFISPGIIDLSEIEMGYSKALMVRDPDGHALLLFEE